MTPEEIQDYDTMVKEPMHPDNKEKSMEFIFTDERVFSESLLRRLRKEIEAEIVRRTEKRLTPAQRHKYGVYANRVKMRICKGCGNTFNARDMRTHPCKIAWPFRSEVGWST
jgi:hypothetical protein